MGAAIVALREQQGLSPAELAERAGVGVERMAGIEAGGIEATWGELRYTAYALNTDLPQLIQEGEMREG